MVTDASDTGTGGPPVIDFHAHMLDRTLVERGARHNVATGFGRRPPPVANGSGVGERARLMLDPGQHLADMDRRGIDIEVLSSATVAQGTAWADPPTALELNRHVNEVIAAWQAEHADRIVGSFTLPLQNLDLALAELERAAGELRLRVANLPAAIDGAYLGAPAFRPLWEAIAELGVVAFIHPDGVRDPWFQDYRLWGSVGQMIEETKVLASLIYEGVLESLPALKVVICHGGGYLAHYFGGLDRNARLAPETARNISRMPSEYLREVYYDTCVFGTETLRTLAERVGSDRLVMGSDYPGGDPDPIQSVRRCVPEEGVAMVLGGTASRLLEIDARGDRRLAGAREVA